jgi:phage minor structural protein
LEGNSAVTKTEYLVKNIIPESQLTYNEDGYIPQYNTGAEKVRTITAKESNYFNILQSIAETFECWMDIVITRDESGTHKTIKFKNFTGDDNYASFRYGVNLKDIQRTYESKQLATKLIVKQNNN